MNTVEVILATLAFLGVWGSLWYKLGKLTKEVQHHNEVLEKVDKRLDDLNEKLNK